MQQRESGGVGQLCPSSPAINITQHARYTLLAAHRMSRHMRRGKALGELEVRLRGPLATHIPTTHVTQTIRRRCISSEQ